MQGQQRSRLKKVDIRILTKMHTMLNKLGLKDYKQDIIDTYAFKGRYIFSSKNLFEKEAEAIIKYLKSVQRAENPNIGEVVSDIYCRKIFACFSVMGWKDQNRRLDLGRVYTWISEHGYLKKHLKKYTVEELPQLVEQVQNLRDAYLLSINQ